MDHPHYIQFAQDLKKAGYSVNEFTFLDNRTVLATYALIQTIRRITTVPLEWKNMGYLQVIYPKIE
jgi:hypothetical protein